MISTRPYCHSDGIPAWRNSHIMGFYSQMVNDGTDAIFKGSHIQSPEDFFNVFTNPDHISLVLVSDNQPAGVVWLTSIRWPQRSAKLHFCYFREFWKISMELGSEAIDFIMDIKKDFTGEGIKEPALNHLWGILPSSNKHAISYMLHIGVEKVGEIREGFYNGDHAEDATFISLTRRRWDNVRKH